MPRKSNKPLKDLVAELVRHGSMGIMYAHDRREYARKEEQLAHAIINKCTHPKIVDDPAVCYDCGKYVCSRCRKTLKLPGMCRLCLESLYGVVGMCSKEVKV